MDAAMRGFDKIFLVQCGRCLKIAGVAQRLDSHGEECDSIRSLSDHQTDSEPRIVSVEQLVRMVKLGGGYKEANAAALDAVNGVLAEWSGDDLKRR